MSDVMTIKTSWAEVNLGEYLKLGRVLKDESLEKSSIKKSLKIVAILSNKSERQINKMSFEMSATLIEKISFVFNQLPKPRPNKPFKIKGKNYMFHPNYDSLTAGEMVSIETIITDSADNKKNFLPEILAVLIRPCYSKRNKEQGKLEHIIEVFETENLEFREALFMKELLVPCFLSRIESFMTGAKLSQIIMSLSSVRRDQLKSQTKELEKLLGRKSH